jgi:predicted membrane-bound spermidine synthase
MAGLGCGSYAGGKIADRLNPRQNLLLFAVAELAIGAFGLFSTTLYYDVLYQRLAHLASTPATMAIVLFLSLLWPTFFMGMSLPLLARGLIGDIRAAARISGALYACNTLGAAAGALLTTWWLLPESGLPGSLRISVALNVVVAIAAVALALGRRTQPSPNSASVSRSEDVSTVRLEHQPPRSELSLPVCAFLYALAGFLALSLEIVWFRLLGVMLKSTAFTFGTLLFVYLTGLGLGAAAASLLLPQQRHAMRQFLWMQTAIGIYVAGSIAVLLAGVDRWPLLRPFSVYLGSYDPIDVPVTAATAGGSMAGTTISAKFFLLYFGLPAILIGPPTLLMGASFPLLQKVVQTDLGRVGSRLGTLLMANILGSTVGCVLTGWLCLAWLGTAGTLKLLVLISGVFAAFGLRRSAKGLQSSGLHWSYLGGIAAIAGVVLCMPDARSLWARLHGARPGSIVFGEDGSGTSVLKMLPGSRESRVVVYVNGLGQSWMPYGGIHTVLGALPAFIHPDPREAAVIGLGSGDTVFGMAGRRELQSITCIEIIRPQVQTLRDLSQRHRYPGLISMLSDPRIRHAHGDGRIYVRHGGRKYDIIEADALRPTSAYAGNLYSDAYFELLRDHLKPGGIAVSWSPTDRVRNTFVKVFPHVLSYGPIVLGSDQRIDLVPEMVRSRVMDPSVVDYYAQAGVDIRTLLAEYIDRVPAVFDPSHDRSILRDINTDLFPKDELGRQ